MASDLQKETKTFLIKDYAEGAKGVRDVNPRYSNSTAFIY